MSRIFSTKKLLKQCIAFYDNTMETEVIENLQDSSGELAKDNFFAQADMLGSIASVKSTNRPASAGWRSQSHNNLLRMSDSHGDSEALLGRFYRFLQFHYIKIKDVWKIPKVETNKETFRQMVSNIGYDLSNV